MTTQRTPPPQIWRGLGLAAVLLLLLSVATIVTISAGIVDPGPSGPPVSRYMPGSMQVAAGEEAHTWIGTAPGSNYTARLSVAHAKGEVDVGYGLLLGEQARYLVTAVSPLGYVTIWEQQGERRNVLLPWQPWPHVQTGSSANEIQVEVVGTAVTVRVNRELLWQGESTAPGPTAGIFLRSFGQGATVAFETLSFYRPAAD